MDRKRPTLQDPDGRFAYLIEPVAKAHGCRLVHVRIGGSQAGSGNALEVFLERQDGEPISMDICALVSREASAILDVENTMGEAAYRLEVGSPGLDRMMTDIADFMRFKGYEVKIEFKRPLSDGQKRMRATIIDARKDGFSVIDDQKRNFDIQMSDLASARLVASDELLKAVQKGQFPKPISLPMEA
jgi:ribosome maturation factor RimP